MIKRLTPLAGLTATGAGATNYLQLTQVIEGIAQVVITIGTATLNIEGRIDDNAPWQNLQTWNSNGAAKMLFLPQMRINVTAVAGGGVVNVWLADSNQASNV